jgi:hypothetical protein
MICTSSSKPSTSFTSGQTGALDYYLKSEPQDYDLYLGGISYGKLNNDNIVEEFTGTDLYKIRQRFYNTLLSLSGEVDIDRALARKGKYYVCNPMVAIQRNGFSDNWCNNRR